MTGVLPIITPRLRLRPVTVADADTLATYRSDPVVAEFQDWPMPYDTAGLLQRLQDNAGRDPDLAAGANLGIEVDGTLVGDVYVRLDNGIAEIGWTLAPTARGHGFATEAATALVATLFAELGAHRIEASLHPDNLASARVCEGIGMLFEAHTRLNFLGRNGWEDDMRYAMLRADWEAWTTRPRQRPRDVALAEITPDDAHLWGRLATHHSQQRLVAPMAKSFRDALFPEVVDGAPVVPWLRGVLADGERVAFVMLAEAGDAHPEPFLWRLLVDRLHQRRGIGDAALRLVVDRLRDRGHRSLLTGWEEGPGSPRPFYERIGFVPTGRDVGGETEARLSW